MVYRRPGRSPRTDPTTFGYTIWPDQSGISTFSEVAAAAPQAAVRPRGDAKRRSTSGGDGHGDSTSDLGFYPNRLINTIGCCAFTRQRSQVRSQ